MRCRGGGALGLAHWQTGSEAAAAFEFEEDVLDVDVAAEAGLSGAGGAGDLRVGDSESGGEELGAPVRRLWHDLDDALARGHPPEGVVHAAPVRPEDDVGTADDGLLFGRRQRVKVGGDDERCGIRRGDGSEARVKVANFAERRSVPGGAPVTL